MAEPAELPSFATGAVTDRTSVRRNLHRAADSRWSGHCILRLVVISHARRQRWGCNGPEPLSQAV